MKNPITISERSTKIETVPIRLVGSMKAVKVHLPSGFAKVNICELGMIGVHMNS